MAKRRPKKLTLAEAIDEDLDIEKLAVTRIKLTLPQERLLRHIAVRDGDWRQVTYAQLRVCDFLTDWGLVDQGGTLLGPRARLTLRGRKWLRAHRDRTAA